MQVDIGSNPTKEQLSNAAQQHFMAQVFSFALSPSYSEGLNYSSQDCLLLQKVDEKQIIVEFSKEVKRLQLEKNEEKRD